MHRVSDYILLSIARLRRALAGPHPLALRIVGDVTCMIGIFLVTAKALAFEVIIDSSTITSVAISVLGVALAFLGTLYWTKRNEQKVLLLKIASMEQQVALVSSQVVPISAAFQAMIIKDLTHDHTPELDLLMTKVGPPSTLTEDEQHRMLELLTHRMDDLNIMMPESEREKAKILPFVMKMAQEEARAIAHPNVIRFVAVPIEQVKPKEPGDKTPVTPVDAIPTVPTDKEKKH